MEVRFFRAVVVFIIIVVVVVAIIVVAVVVIVVIADVVTTGIVAICRIRNATCIVRIMIALMTVVII